MFDYKKDLKPALKKIGMKQIELAQKLGKSDRAIKGWVAGTNTPTYDGHLEVMKILGLEDNYYPSDNALIPVVEVPVLDFVQAGEFTDSNSEIEPIDYLKVPIDLVPENGFSLKVQGDSMLYDNSDQQRLSYKYSKYTLLEGENILVDPNQISPQNLVGKVVVARNADGATVKLLHKEANRLCLMPLNSAFQNNDGIKYPSAADIIGKVVTSINIKDFN